MSKRFLDTEFFKKPLIRSFEGPYKALYAFIICDCDNAGIWNPDCQVASIYVGFNISLSEVKKNFAGKYVELYNGQWFFPGFIKHQYPAGLQISNPAHKKVIEKLKFFDLIDKNLRIRLIKGGAPKELARPSQGSKEEDKEEEKDKVVEKEEGKVKEKAPKKTKIRLPQLLFKDSQYFNFNLFQMSFFGTDYEKFDTNFKYYHEQILNWSTAKDEKRADWLATAKIWITRDYTDGKLITNNHKPGQNGKSNSNLDESVLQTKFSQRSEARKQAGNS